jgi:predicted DNA-binding transcriptional regulator YafY
MPRGDALKRQWSLVQLLQSRRYGLTLDDLAREMGCTRRTIQRDIGVLRRVGLPIKFVTSDQQHGQRCYALPLGFFDGNEMLLTITEALSLYLAKAFMAPLAGTSIGDGFSRLLKRIEKSLSEKTVRHFQDLQGLLLVLPPAQSDYSKCRDTVAAVDTAVRDHRVLKITYHSQWRNDDYTTEVHPYGLVFSVADLYLVAYSEHAGDIRIFKITRIRHAELTNKVFNRPEDFDLESHFSASLSVARSGQPFEACVEFTGPAMSLVEESKWHPSQRIVARENHRLQLKLKLCDPVGLKQWVKSFGPHAELLSPQALREDLGRELSAAADLYKKAGKATPAQRKELSTNVRSIANV